jgi:hypothetical protein
MKQTTILLLLSILLFTSCSKERIDSSTSDTFKKSVAKLSADLSLEEKKVFKKAIMHLFKSQSKSKNPLEAFHNKSVNEILSIYKKADDIRKEQRHHRVKDLKKFIQTYQNGINPNELQKFIVTNASIKKENNHHSNMVKMQLKVHNKSDKTIYRISFVGHVTSQGEPTPWATEIFKYTLKDGIKANQTADWTFYAQADNNQWKNLPSNDIHTDFIVETTMLQGKSGQILAANYKDHVSLKQLQEFKDELALLESTK